MKNRIYILFIAIIGMSAFGCSDLRFGDAFLEKAPGVDVTVDTIFSSKLYADRALVAAYSTLRVGFPIHNTAWPIVNGPYDPGKRDNRACSQLDNDNMDAITDLMESHNDWDSGGQSYAAGNYSAEAENGNSWTKLGFTPDKELNWSGIRRAFLYIENVDRVPDMTEQEKAYGKGEAYLIIATHYLDMFRHYGGIPLLKSSVAADNVMEYDFSRRKAEDVHNYIIELCEKAEELLPWTVTPERDGHLTKAAAMGLKCRALLFAASPIFNSNEPYSSNTPSVMSANADYVKTDDIPLMYWFGKYDPQRWQDVADACEAFIKENKANGDAYGLVKTTGTTEDDYRNNWNTSYVDRYNHEILIQTGRHYDTFANTYLRCYFGVSDDNGNTGRGYGGGCVTLNFVDMFQKVDGTPALYKDWIAKNGNVSKIADDPFRGRDPRLYESVMINGDHFRGRAAEMWVDGRERGSASGNRAITGFCSRKYIWDYNDETFMNRPLNYSYLRMPEIYLTYAEALNELGRKEEALYWLNLVRQRVGIADMTEELLEANHSYKTLPSYNGLIGDPKLREEILDERARELFFEECRWYDIVRWKREDIFKKDLYGIVITLENAVRTEDTNNDGVVNDIDSINPYESTFRYSDPNMEDERYWKKNWDTKWYLSAFPTDEINKGYGLVQNPGW